MHRSARSLPVILRDWVLLLPFLLASLLAPGTMPHRAEDGILTVVLCTGAGPAEIRIDLATGEVLPGGPDKADNRCDWQTAREGVAAAPAPLALAERFAPAKAVVWSMASAPALPAPHSRPEPRGPPFPI